MDVLGAQALAARIRAGVRIGSQIELVGPNSPVGEGERGEVRGFTPDGCIVVAFEDQLHTMEIDPEVTPYRRLAA